MHIKFDHAELRLDVAKMLRVYDTASATVQCKHGLIERLTNRYEAARPEPWKITDAPADYIEKMLGTIVGIEIPVTKLVGKWKASQNKPPVDREGVIRGLSEFNDADTAAKAVLVRGSANS